MSNLTAEALNQFWLAEYYTLGTALKGGLKQWIRGYQFETNFPCTSTDKFQLQYAPEKSPLRGMAYDCNRFSMAAIETFYCLNRAPPNVLRNSIPWLCIESYYAAFYSAHAILRLFGQSCTNLEAADTNAIKKILDLYQFGSPIPTGGYYNITVNTISRTMQFDRVSGSKRPHQHLWNEFDGFLDHAIATLTADSLRYQPVLLKLQSLKRNLNVSGANGGVWLSLVREDVNYKHGREAWFPYAGVKRLDIDKIVTSVANLPTESLSIDLDCCRQNEMIKYFNTTTYIVTLCCELFQHIKDKSAVKVFPSDGPLKLLNLLAA